MYELTNFITNWGHISLPKFWFPLLLWSLVALLIHLLLKWKEPKDVLYNYHLRVALVAGIPAGLMTSTLTSWLNGLLSIPNEAPGQLSLLVLQNPISVTSAGGQTSPSIAWDNPYLWIGMGTALIASICVAMFLRSGWNYFQITRYARSLHTNDLRSLDLLKSEDRQLARSIPKSVSVAYSGEMEVPFTFGWFAPVIVIPNFLKSDPEKCRMAIRHELMHIKRGDFLVNSFMMVMKSMLWFHPLIHTYDREIKEAREISCDSDVLTDRSISRKEYAQLLFELAPRQEAYARQLVSMSVNKSTLQKRIKTMTTLTNTSRPFTKSLLVSLALLLSVSGIIACSDLQEGGITNTEIQDTQAQMQNLEDENEPLFVIREDTDLDGNFDTEEIATPEESKKISRIKSEYIKSIEVLKKEIPEEYASLAKNGLVFLNLINKEQAFSDLKSLDEVQQAQKPEKEYFVVVEEMPSLKGGLETIQKCVNYPEEARVAGIEGRVIVQFIVNKEGVVESPKVVRSVGGGTDEEAIRCVKTAQFEPGKQRGKPVPVQYALPVQFNLSDSATEEKASAKVEQPKVEGQAMALQNFAQNSDGSISGRLVETETGEPIMGANVVFSGTNAGTSTNENGEFYFDHIPAGAQELSISHIQYQRQTLSLN